MLSADTPSIVRYGIAAFGILLLAAGSLVACLLGKAVGSDIGAALCYGPATLRGGVMASGLPGIAILAVLLATTGGGIALIVGSLRRPRRDALYWAVAPVSVFALGVLAGAGRCGM